MKKNLLATVALMSATLALQAAQKTVSFDFSNPETYGYATPVAGSPVDVTSINADGLTLTGTNLRFNLSKEIVALSINSDLVISAGEGEITAISLTGEKCSVGADGNLIPSETTGWTSDASAAEWAGSLSSMTLTKSFGVIRLYTLTVTFIEKEGGDAPAVEKYIAIETEVTDISAEYDAENDRWNYSSTATNVVAPEFANAVIGDGKSEVTFGTASMDVIALGGTTPKDVMETEAGVFPGWAEWNDVKWDNKNQNLDDKKTTYFSYIVGTGNPCVEVGHEAVMTDGAATGMWRATYVYYGPQDTEVNGKVYRNQMPVQGLYYKFMPKADGDLKITVWSNKGNRNTFVVDGETAQPVAYTAEGYINGQNEPLEDGTSRKKYLTPEEIQTLHDNAKCQKTEEGEIIPGTDSAPYVIGAGNQNFWGYLNVAVKAGKTYWLFQDSSQIGFAGYEFAPSGAAAIHVVEAPTAVEQGIYNLRGERVGQMQPGQIYIVNGRKQLCR